MRTVELVVLLPNAAPGKQWSWWNDASQGGGALGAIGSHLIDALRFLFDGCASPCGLPAGLGGPRAYEKRSAQCPLPWLAGFKSNVFCSELLSEGELLTRLVRLHLQI